MSIGKILILGVGFPDIGIRKRMIHITWGRRGCFAHWVFS